jgi:hypothetical protein
VEGRVEHASPLETFDGGRLNAIARYRAEASR